MVNRAQKINIRLGFSFLLLVSFPFGQLLRVDIFPVIDLIVFLSVLFEISQGKFFKLVRPLSAWFPFFWAAIFSFLFSLSFFEVGKILFGFLYFIRIVFYGLYFCFVSKIIAKSEKNKNLLLNSLVAVGFFTAIFGWFQYLFYSDLRALVQYGWDDHFLRLTSTFLDPAFTGVILALALIAAFYSLKGELRLLLSFFLLLTLAFTYSRASYLALIVAGILAWLTLKKNRKLILVGLSLFIGLIFMLPRGESEGVKLERVNSIVAKNLDFQKGLALFEKSPIFGLGFNNLCLAKEKFLLETELNSHSCSGLDNSLLLLGATTGVVGLITFASGTYRFFQGVSKDIYGKIFFVSTGAILIHSFFTNTLFYPWVMIWIIYLAALSRKKEVSG